MDDQAENHNEVQMVSKEDVASIGMLQLDSLWDWAVKKLQVLYDGDINKVKKYYAQLLGIYSERSETKDKCDYTDLHRQLEALDGIMASDVGANNCMDDNSICSDWDDNYDSKSNTETEESSCKSVTSCNSDTFSDTESETSRICCDSEDSDVFEPMEIEKEKEAEVSGNLIQSQRLLCNMDTERIQMSMEVLKNIIVLSHLQTREQIMKRLLLT